eukprot:3961682-Prymnesium_polylepis.1
MPSELEVGSRAFTCLHCLAVRPVRFRSGLVEVHAQGNAAEGVVLVHEAHACRSSPARVVPIGALRGAVDQVPECRAKSLHTA